MSAERELYRAKRLLTWTLERLDPDNEDDAELAEEIRDFLEKP